MVNALQPGQPPADAKRAAPAVHDDQFARISADRNRPAWRVLVDLQNVLVHAGWIVEAVEAECYSAGGARRPVTSAPRTGGARGGMPSRPVPQRPTRRSGAITKSAHPDARRCITRSVDGFLDSFSPVTPRRRAAPPPRAKRKAS